MTEFVDACRQEWKRLGVPEAVANEMAADLDADLDEARAEGVSAEEVIGSGVFDPRSFAAEWATERGVVPTPAPTLVEDRPAIPAPKTRNRTLTIGAVTAAAVIAFIGFALAIRHSGSVAVTRVVGPLKPFAPPRVEKWPVPFAVHGPGTPMHGIGVVLFLAGVAVLIAAALYWSRRARTTH